MVKIIAAGMPASGKSTFIAALTHLLNQQQLSTRLALARLSEDEGHLSSLEAQWLDVSRLDRTKKVSERWVTFHVRDAVDGSEGELLVPDLRGELFEQPGTTGRCQRTLWEALLDCDGLLLFTNANRGKDDILVDQVSDVMSSVLGEALPEQVEERPNALKTTSFKSSEIPEEAKLVELLQAMNRYPLRMKARRLAVVISAWDVVRAEQSEDPPMWLAEHRPMLSQYIAHNDDAWDVRVYGVSAQGGEIPREQAGLREIQTPGERIKIVGPDARGHDLTMIVHWLMTPAESSDGR